MFATACLLALLLPARAGGEVDFDVVGLLPGEEHLPLAPAPEVERVHGRVIDAFSGRPVVGATVDTWMEEIGAVFGGFGRVASARSGADGCFALEEWRGGGEKARVRAAGYLTLSTTAAELDGIVRLFPAPPSPARLRVLDLQDRPVAGARVTTTYSCSHDVPAFDAHTDARGVVELPDWGLQDDVQELRLRAPGFAAIEYLDLSELERASDGAWVARLRRRRGGAFWMLDDAGAPLAHTVLHVLDDDGYHVARTDADGRVRLPARYGAGALVVELLAEPEDRFVYELVLPHEHEPRLRRHPEDWPADTPLGSVRIDWPAAPPADWRLALQLQHEQGWCLELGPASAEPIAFPAGRASLVFGAPFRGYAQERVEFELRAGEETLVAPSMRAEPQVELRLPEGEWEALWVEAGPDSVRAPLESGPLSVPSDQPLSFVLFGERETRRMRVERAVPGLVVDLSADATRMAGVPTSSTRSVLRVDVEGARPELDSEVRVSSRRGECELSHSGLGTGEHYQVFGPPGEEFVLRYEREGCATTWLRARLPVDPFEERSQTLRAVELASLELSADFDFALRGFHGRAAARKHVLQGVHPGPLQLVVEGPGGALHALHLELEAGALRRIELKR